MKTIASLSTLSTALASTDYFIVHNSSGDFKVPYSSIDKGVNHNCIFRGKNLGTVSSSNIDTFLATYGITDGAFTDIYPGDYFSITYSYNGTSHTNAIRITGLDIFYNTGDTALTSHHIVCVPDTTLGENSPMNSTATTGVSTNEANTSGYGAYYGSDMNQITIPALNTSLEAVFGDHLLTHRELLGTTMDANATSAGVSSWTGATSARAWEDVTLCLLSEVEIYGSTVFSSSGLDEGIARQHPMFSLNPRYISNSRYGTWLRNVTDHTRFCLCTNDGRAHCTAATGVHYVRPRFLLG